MASNFPPAAFSMAHANKEIAAVPRSEERPHSLGYHPTVPPRKPFMPPSNNAVAPMHEGAGGTHGYTFDGGGGGSKQHRREPQPARVSIPASALTPARTGVSYTHKLLSQPWTVFLLIALAAYGFICILAGVLLLAVSGNIESSSVLSEKTMLLAVAEKMPNATSTNPLSGMDLWEKVFFLGSGNILGAGGIGDLVATDTRGYGIVFVQQLLGIVMQSFLAAFILLKLTSPKMRVILSDRGLISVRNGMPVLVFRIGDKKNPNRLPETAITLTATIPSISEEGEAILIEAVLPIQRSGVALDAMTISHTILPSSPLYGISRETLAPGGVFENVAVSVDILHKCALFDAHQPRTYTADDLLVGRYAFHPMRPAESFWDNDGELNREDFNQVYELQNPKLQQQQAWG